MRYPKYVTFSIHVEPDDLGEVHGSFATGDDRADRRHADDIIRRAAAQVKRIRRTMRGL